MENNKNDQNDIYSSNNSIRESSGVNINTFKAES